MYDVSVIICHGDSGPGYAYHRILHFKGLVPDSIAFVIRIADTILTIGQETLFIV